VVWRKPVRKRWVRQRQARRNAVMSALRDRRTVSVTAVAAREDVPEFGGYAVELLDEVARVLGIHFKYYAVPRHGSSSVRGGQTPDHGMWSPLVDQLITEASPDYSRLARRLELGRGDTRLSEIFHNIHTNSHGQSTSSCVSVIKNVIDFYFCSWVGQTSR